jgi:protein-tyrosine phosphatase
VTDTLLAVCSANICRSPLGLAALDDAFLGHGFHHRITLRSCGDNADPGSAVCGRALQVAHSHGLRTRLVDHLQATALDVAELAAAELILTADRRVRSSVVKLDPRAAERTFTFREAAELARLVTADPTGDRPRDLAGFAAALHDNRGLTDLPGMERSSGPPWRRLTVHAHDVPDAHLDRQVSHRAVYQALVPAVQELARQLTAYASARQQ